MTDRTQHRTGWRRIVLATAGAVLLTTPGESPTVRTRATFRTSK